MKGVLNGNVDTESVYVGVMAQDLLDMKISEAVLRSPTSGYYSVDYSKIDVDFHKLAGVVYFDGFLETFVTLNSLTDGVKEFEHQIG